MKTRLTAWHSTSTMSQEVSPAFLNLPFLKWYSIESNPEDGLTRYAESSARGITWEVILFGIAASSVGIVTVVVTILWMAKLGEILSN